MRRALTTRHLTLLGVEDCLVALALLAAMKLRLGADMNASLFDAGQWFRLGVVVFVTQLSFYYNDLYELQVLNSKRELFIRLLQALGVASIILAVLYYLYPGLILGRGVFLIFVLIALCAVIAWRLAYRAVLATRGMSIRILIVGAGNLCRTVFQETLTRKPLGFQVVGCLAAVPAEVEHREGLPPVLGSFEEALSYAQRPDVDRVVVAIDERRGTFPVRQLLELRLSGKRVEDACAWYEELTGKMLIEHLKPSDLIFAEGFAKPPITVTVKRVVDVLASAVGVAVALPIWATIPLLIKLDSAGPVFFRQERVGEKGKTFKVLKFRSMTQDAEQMSGPVWAMEKDPRITRVGRFVRKTRIDEIPQFLNVLRGDMSLVGPRPERPFFVAQLADQVPYYSQRHTVKPGITGLAQVKYEYGSTVEDALEKLRYDLYYIKRMNLWMDLSVIFETVKVVIFGRGR